VDLAQQARQRRVEGLLHWAAPERCDVSRVARAGSIGQSGGRDDGEFSCDFYL
jgi:hypothetical protein